MDLSYQRVMRSPHLSPALRRLTQGYIDTSKLLSELDALTACSHERRATFRRHELGRSALGNPLVGWTLGDPHLPRLICASQHHGPENYGASFSLHLSHLLLSDPLFTPLLKRFSFSFLPQQNPDALTARGNSLWMIEPSWESFVQHYQYDPRRFDVEHGVPPQRLAGDSSVPYRRPESEAFTRWVRAEHERYGAPIYYQSGHAWGILDAPLYLMYPNLSSSAPAHTTWAGAVQEMTATAPYQRLTPRPPLTDDYELPEWLEQGSEGFYVLPTREAFLKSNPDSQVQCSSMDVVAQLAPEARILVIEPPIFSSPLLTSNSPATHDTLEALKEAALLHERAVERCDQLWRARLEAQFDGLTVDDAYLSEREEDRALAQLRLETLERRGVGARWERLVDQRHRVQDHETESLPTGLARLATIDQHFSASNLLALAKRVTQDEALQRLSANSDKALSGAQLSPWAVEWGVFVYLCPLLATIFSEDSVSTHV